MEEESYRIGEIIGSLKTEERIVFNAILKIAHIPLLMERRNFIFDKPRKTRFTVRVEDFCELTNIDVETLKTLFAQLQKKIFKLEWRNEKGEIYEIERSPLLSYFTIKKEDITFEISSLIHDTLCKQDFYYLFYFPVISQLKKAHSLKLYNQIFERKNYGEWIIDVKSLRNLMNIKEEEYERFERFRAKVIDEPIEEITKIWDINLHYEKIKDSYDKRKVGKIRFLWDVRKFNDFEEAKKRLLNLNFIEEIEIEEAFAGLIKKLHTEIELIFLRDPELFMNLSYAAEELVNSSIKKIVKDEKERQRVIKKFKDFLIDRELTRLIFSLMSEADALYEKKKEIFDWWPESEDLYEAPEIIRRIFETFQEMNLLYKMSSGIFN